MNTRGPVVEIQNLWSVFRVAGRKAVIHQDLNLRIERGEVLSIVGGSGSGKTVLLRQILGLETPARGQVMVMANQPARWGATGLPAGSVCCFSTVRCSPRSACSTTLLLP